MSPKHDREHDRSHAHPNDSDSAPQATDRPTFLTVEEAARVLRIGRTTAYALTKEWRSTNGRSGLPVVNVGHKLRVPACQLEQLAGGQLRERIEPPPDHGGPETSSAARSHQPTPEQPPHETRTDKHARPPAAARTADQATLFDPTR